MSKSSSPFDADTAMARSLRPAKNQAKSQAKSQASAPVSARVRGQKPSAAVLGFLMIWHGALSGGFFVAMLTGEGAYGAHVFAGIVVIVAIVLRLTVGTAVPKGHVLSFPFPKFKSLMQGSHGVRRFLSHTVGLAMLLFCAMATLTGWYVTTDTSAHSAIAYVALALIGGHVVLVILMQGWKKVEAKMQAKL